MLTNLFLFLFYGGISLIIGLKATLLIFAPLLIMTAWIGGWLFYIQHQYEDAYWQHNPEWDVNEAALMGSSYYKLPKLLQWFTGNIGLHHIHHLCSRIPNYKLQSCLDSLEELRKIKGMSFRKSLKCIFYNLWDEEKQKMVSFKNLEQAT